MNKIHPVVQSTTPCTPQFHFLGAQFVVGGAVVPYATISMSLYDAAEYLRTPDELPGWDDSDAELEALYQRQLDYRRVSDKIVPYLENENAETPRFFNAITVALIPHRERRFQEYSGGLAFNAPALGVTGTTSEVVAGPLRLGFYAPFDVTDPNSYGLGVMRWNPTEMAAVAVDGQHRLAALKQLYRKDPSRVNSTRVCIILVIPAPQLGFSAQAGGMRRLLRSLFIDLNKYAKPVKRARLILLDDVDPYSLIIRAMIGDRLRAADPVSPLEAGRLPLALVDWHGDEAKFDTGPYVTSVLMLDRILALILQCTAVDDWGNSRAVLAQVASFRKLGFEPTPACGARLDSLRNADDDLPGTFVYPGADLELIRDVVGRAVADLVNCHLVRLAPYRDVIAIRSHTDALSPAFSTWYEAFSAHDGTPQAEARRNLVEERIRSEPGGVGRIAGWNELVEGSLAETKGESLFFKVVFQAAYFHAIREVMSVSLPAIGDAETDPERGSYENFRQWGESAIETVNGMLGIEPLLFHANYSYVDEDQNVTFWAGSVLKVTRDTIDYSNSALERTSKWLQLVIVVGEAVRRWTRAQLPRKWADFRALLVNIDEDCERKIALYVEWIAYGNTGNAGSMTRIARAMYPGEEDAEIIREAADVQLDTRLDHLWGLLRRLRTA